MEARVGIERMDVLKTRELLILKVPAVPALPALPKRSHKLAQKLFAGASFQ